MFAHNVTCTTQAQIFTSLTPLQLGVVVKGRGYEAIIHAVNSTPPEEKWTLLLDLKKAF